MDLTLITAPATEPITLAEAKRQLLMGASAGEPAPTVPTVALAGAGAGNCDNGAWRIGFTFVTADGETEIGPLSAAVTVADKTVNGKLAVTNIALGGTNVTARNAYAVPPAGGAAKYVGQIANNTDSTLTVNIAASALGVEAPSVNTTLDPEITRRIKTAREGCELGTLRALITQTWDLVLDRFPCEPFIEIPKPPLQSVTHLKYRNTAGTLTTWASSNYVLTGDTASPPVLNPRQARGRLSLAPGITWPSTYGQAGDVVLRFVCGYGAASAVPAMLKDAMLMDLAAKHGPGRDGLITGTIVAKLPSGGPDDIYWSYKSHPTQKLVAA